MSPSVWDGEPVTSERPPRNRMRDFWQLDVPLALVLLLCTTLTVVEVSRATDGNWRALVYSFEWPLIAAFSIWMWVRFRTEGNPASRVARRWRERVAQYEAEALATEQSDVDPELRAWREYVSGLGPTDADREGPASMPPSLERP